MEIKRITSSESNLVIELFDKYRIFYKQLSDIKLAESFIQERLDNNESVIYVATVRNNDKVIPVGFTQLYPTYSSMRTTKNWILNDLYVAQEYRNQRIGENLIKTAMKFAKDSGATFVELSTGIDNYTAQSLYETIGFKKQSPGTDFLTYRINVD